MPVLRANGATKVNMKTFNLRRLIPLDLDDPEPPSLPFNLADLDSVMLINSAPRCLHGKPDAAHLKSGVKNMKYGFRVRFVSPSRFSHLTDASMQASKDLIFATLYEEHDEEHEEHEEHDEAAAAAFARRNAAFQIFSPKFSLVSNETRPSPKEIELRLFSHGGGTGS